MPSFLNEFYFLIDYYNIVKARLSLVHRFLSILSQCTSLAYSLMVLLDVGDAI